MRPFKIIRDWVYPEQSRRYAQTLPVSKKKPATFFPRNPVETATFFSRNHVESLVFFVETIGFCGNRRRILESWKCSGFQKTLVTIGFFWKPKNNPGVAAVSTKLQHSGLEINGAAKGVRDRVGFREASVFKLLGFGLL